VGDLDLGLLERDRAEPRVYLPHSRVYETTMVLRREEQRAHYYLNGKNMTRIDCVVLGISY